MNSTQNALRNDEVLLTPAEVTRRLSISDRTLSKLRLPHIRRGNGHRRYLLSGVVEYMRSAAIEA